MGDEQVYTQAIQLLKVNSNLGAAALASLMVAVARWTTPLGPAVGADDATKARTRRLSTALAMGIGVGLTFLDVARLGGELAFFPVLWQGLWTGVLAAGGSSVVKGVLGR